MPCDAPTLIRNPYYRCDPSKKLNYLHDCKSQFIRVPCHKCGSCIAVEQMYLVQRVLMESLVSHLFFTTLTYCPEQLPVLNVNGFPIKYANMKHFSDMVKRLRKVNAFGRPFNYFVVSELGSKTGRPHFHCLWFLPKYEDDTYNTCLALEKTIFNAVLADWRVNVSDDWRKPVYEKLCRYVRRFVGGQLRFNYDTHFVTPSFTSAGESDVAFYVLKYMLKRSSREERLQQALRLNLDPEEYTQIWNTVKTKKCCSKHFGLGSDTSTPHPVILSHLKKGIKQTPAGTPYPLFVNPHNGMTFPLCPYYKQNCKIYSFMDAYDIIMNSPNDVYNDDSFNAVDALRHMSEYQKKSQMLNTKADLFIYE